MPITKQFTAPNGVSVSYHRVTSVEGQLPSLVMGVSSWPSYDAYASGLPPMYRTPIPFDASDVLASMEATVLLDERFSGAQPSVESGDTLEVVKQRRKLQVNAWRMEANLGSFQFGGKQIACDRLSRSDIDGVNGDVANNGEFPAGFPHAWKAVDNSYVPIPDVATWRSFYSAMVSQGIANFIRSQALKAMIDAATSEEDVSAINWETPLP